MMDKKPELSFEEALEQYYTAPEPRPAFLAGLEQRLAHLPGPTPAAARPRLRLAYAGLALMLALVVSLAAIGPGRVLAAIRGLVGYIPGFGLVEEETSLRVLAEPVSVTREGVTVTIRQVVLSPEQASLTYTVQGLPPAAIPSWIAGEGSRICAERLEMKLTGGATREGFVAGSAGYTGDNLNQFLVHFEPLPAGADRAELQVPCIYQTLKGKAPEDWVIPLEFVPAPPDMEPLPVVEITSATTESAYPLALDRVIETEDGYIFMGSFRRAVSAQVDGMGPEIRDGNGHLLGYRKPDDLRYSADFSQPYGWAYQVRGKDLAWPITIRFDKVDVICDDEAASSFTFDTGPNPTEGQEWTINRDFSVDICNIHLDTIERKEDGYLFKFTADGVNQIMPRLDAGKLTTIETILVPGGEWTRLVFDQKLPEGKITVSISAFGEIQGPWEVQWQPEP